MHQIKWVSPHGLKPNSRNARTHSKKQIRQIADSVLAFGFVVPIVVDENNTILLGHGRLAAAIDLDLNEVPVIVIEGLSEAKKRALLLADNKITENAGWDRKRLHIELPELAELLIEEGLDISITGFEPVEIDQIAIDFEEDTSDPADTIESAWLTASVVSKHGDIWQLGEHRLLCGDARDRGDLDRIMAGKRAAMAFLDPPYNVGSKASSGADASSIPSSPWPLARCRPASSQPFWRKRSGTPLAPPETARFISSAWTGRISES
jgi:ParB-like nuclease domain